MGLLLFVIFIADLFYINDNLCYAGCAGDTIPHVCGFNFAEAIDFLEPNIKNFVWFGRNRLKAISGKSHFFVSRTKKQDLKMSDSFNKFQSVCRAFGECN